MYIDVNQLSPEEKTRKKRQIKMQQLSDESDLKKIQRRQTELEDDLRRLKQERSRLDVYIKENEEEVKKNKEKEEYVNDALHHIKKQLIELE